MSDTEVDFAKLVGKPSVGEKEPGHFKECPALFTKSVNNDRRQITACASAGTLDRDGEIILPSAFKELLPVYMKNAVVIISHQHWLETGHSSVVANVTKAWVDGKGLWVVIEFIKGTELADEYWLLYSTKKQRALSVGFIPKEHRYEDVNGKIVFVHTKVELIEISLCAVPSNRDALSRSKQRKADFVAKKAYEKMLAGMVPGCPAFEEKCQEFADALMSGEYDICEGEYDTDCDFVKAVSGECENETDYASLVAGS